MVSIDYISKQFKDALGSSVDKSKIYMEEHGDYVHIYMRKGALSSDIRLPESVFYKTIENFGMSPFFEELKEQFLKGIAQIRQPAT